MPSPKWNVRLPQWMADRIEARMLMTGKTKTVLLMEALMKEYGPAPENWVPNPGGVLPRMRPPELVAREAAEAKVNAPVAVLDPYARGCQHPKDALRKLGYMTRCGVCGERIS